MRPITPLVASDFHGRVQNMIQRFEVNIDGAWVNITGYESVTPIDPDVVNTNLVVQDMTHAHTANNVILFYNTAGVVYAASCSLADVQAAITAADPCDTVMVPAGSATWASALLVDKPLLLIGAGIGQTIITHSGLGISAAGEDGFPLAIAHMTLVKTGSSASIRITGNCKNFRIHHIAIDNQAYTAYVVFEIGAQTGWDYTSGLIDNCVLPDSRILIMAGNGEGSWKAATGLGGADAVYIEDCQFYPVSRTSGNCVDGNNGMRTVVRYNTFEDTYLMTHSLSNGTATSFVRGSRLSEFYNNTFTAKKVGYSRFYAMRPRAGTGMVFNNQVLSEGGETYSGVTMIDNVRTYETKSGLLGRADGGNIIDMNLPIASGTGEGVHTGANDAATLTCAGKTWTINEFAYSPARYYVWNVTDGSRGPITANTADTITAVLAGGTDNDWDTDDVFLISDGYHALDQIGRGQDDGVLSADPYYQTPRYEDTSRQPQDSEPMYIWNNTRHGSLANPVVGNGTARHVGIDRDFFRQEAAFDGSSGMGVGLRSARPLREDMSGAPAGVAWWATDESKLYRWTGTVWVLHYTPYTYPHPLRSDPVLGD